MGQDVTAIPLWLEAHPADADALVRSVSAMVTDRVLRAIAEADYGDRKDQYEAALRKVRKGEPPPNESVSWAVPWEVLRLVQFPNPESDDSSMRVLSVRERAVAKAWACAVLVRFNDDWRDGALPRLVDVLATRFPELLPSCAGLLRWLLTFISDEYKRRPVMSACAVVQRKLGAFTPEG
jgi:hypothetical protein